MRNGEQEELQRCLPIITQRREERPVPTVLLTAEAERDLKHALSTLLRGVARNPQYQYAGVEPVGRSQPEEGRGGDDDRHETHR